MTRANFAVPDEAVKIILLQRTGLPEMDRVLSKTGSVVIDVRRDSPGLNDLRSRFGNVATISEKPKFLRVLARR